MKNYELNFFTSYNNAEGTHEIELGIDHYIGTFEYSEAGKAEALEAIKDEAESIISMITKKGSANYYTIDFTLDIIEDEENLGTQFSYFVKLNNSLKVVDCSSELDG